ncbi:MAG: hypothetical protein ABI658_25250 [Acidimicrobiales bacterium]
MSTLGGFSTALLTPSLGSLLHEYRAKAGESAKTVSRRCSLGVVEIAQVELGRAELDIDELADAVSAYGVRRSLFPVGRCRVVVDLVAGTVAAHVTAVDMAETAADRILLAYFELTFSTRSMAPATAVPFTDLDLDVLRVILASRRREVSEHLARIAGPFDESSVLPEIVTRRAARSAFLVLAATAATFAAVALPFTTSSNQPAPVQIEPTIIDAVVITR